MMDVIFVVRLLSFPRRSLSLLCSCGSVDSVRWSQQLPDSGNSTRFTHSNVVLWPPPKGAGGEFLAVDADDDAHNAESMLLVQRLLKKCVTNIRYSVLFCFSPQSLPRFSRAAAVHGAQGGPLRMCALHPFSLYRFVCVCAYERQTKLSLLLRLLSSFSCGYSY